MKTYNDLINHVILNE